MQAVFGEHKSTKLFHELFAFDESLTSTNSVPNRYFYPVCPRGLSIIPNPDYRIQVRGPGLSIGTLLKIINLLFPSSFIQIAEGCNINFEGFEQRPAPQ